ncbi:MAG: dipeptidase [Ignavibacteriales bacterium]|nr:dipeptidase [Ignavibacteriales bacterium]
MIKMINYLNSNFENYIEELKDFLRIKSISSKEEHKDDMINCANNVADKMRNIGLENVNVFQTEGHPIVYGDWLHAKGKPTVLVYGHYDVQPVDPLDLWDNPPFDPIIKDGKIWARGANDDKGQMFGHFKSVEAFMKVKGELPVNIKFLIEGEEEIGSPSLTKFLPKNKDLLKADCVLISDTSMFAPDTPTITYGLRGLTYMEIEVTGPNRDLHSGSFGGAVANPINELAKIISQLQDKRGKIKIPNFYDDVVKLTKKERDNFRKLKYSDKQLAQELGVKQLQGEEGYITLERLWARPTLDCNGIVGGYTEKGAKTVLPSKASAKISMRLVPNQDPKNIAKLFEKYVRSIAPKSIQLNVSDLHGGSPLLSPLTDKAVIAAAKATEKAFGKKTVYTREGGSIPIVVEFMKQLKATPILMGMGLDTDNIHSPNEHFLLKNLKYGMLSSLYFLEEYSKI